MKIGDDIVALLLHVDDILIIGNSFDLLTNFLSDLKREFDMKDLGNVHYFLGIQAQYTNTGLFLSQTRYASNILQKAVSNKFNTQNSNKWY